MLKGSGGSVAGFLQFDLVPGLVRPGSDLVPSFLRKRKWWFRSRHPSISPWFRTWFSLVPTWLHRSKWYVLQWFPPGSTWFRHGSTWFHLVAQRRQPWTETVVEFGARLRDICDHFDQTKTLGNNQRLCPVSSGNAKFYCTCPTQACPGGVLWG